MAVRNKYDVDETLETPFSFKHFKRAVVYAKRHTKKMILAMSASMVSALSSMVYPLILQRAFDVVIPFEGLCPAGDFDSRNRADDSVEHCYDDDPFQNHDPRRAGYHL